MNSSTFYFTRVGGDSGGVDCGSGEVEGIWHGWWEILQTLGFLDAERTCESWEMRGFLEWMGFLVILFWGREKQFKISFSFSRNYLIYRHTRLVICSLRLVFFYVQNWLFLCWFFCLTCLTDIDMLAFVQSPLC